MSRILAAALLFGLAQDGALPRQGYLIERRVRQTVTDLIGKNSEIQRTERVKITATAVVLEDLTFGRTIIIRADKKIAWVVDSLSGTYSELTFEAIRERRDTVIAELREVRKRVPGTADEAEIAGTLVRLGDLPGDAAVAVKDDGKTEKINGQDCPIRKISLGEKYGYALEESPLDPSLAGALVYYDLLAQIGAIHPKVAEAYKSLPGFPVRGKSRCGIFFDLITSTDEVTSGAKAEFPASDFELPLNLKKIPLKGFELEATKPPEKPAIVEKSFKEDDIDKGRNPLKDEKK